MKRKRSATLFAFALGSWLFLFPCFTLAEEGALPYLGPGIKSLSKEEYQRVYKTYIQSSISLGYPFLQASPQACGQALDAVFRQAGMFSYPVPKEAQQVSRTLLKIGGVQTEAYELGGMLLQLVRTKEGAPDRLFWINSSSPKAVLLLSKTVRKEILLLEKDSVTGLERVKGLPVGFPHPYLNQSGQGLFVRILKFNGKNKDCLPLEFFDNGWNAGFDLTNQRCLELQGDAEKVWTGEMGPGDFYLREKERLKKRAMDNAKAHGEKEEAAKALVEKYFVEPLTSEISVVGAAMRNLAQCNLLAMGNKERVIPESMEKPSISAPESGAIK